MGIRLTAPALIERHKTAMRSHTRNLMRPIIPACIAACLAALVGTASAASYKDVTRAVTDDALLQTAGVDPAQAELRKQCKAAVLETDDPPEFFDCVYVQTAKDLNLFSLEDGYLMSELQLKLHNMDGVALQHMGRVAQLQIFSGRRVTALYIHRNNWIDAQETRAVYEWLLERGVRAREPQRWIGP
jgi:hypothetical protein